MIVARPPMVVGIMVAENFVVHVPCSIIADDAEDESTSAIVSVMCRNGDEMIAHRIAELLEMYGLADPPDDASGAAV